MTISWTDGKCGTCRGAGYLIERYGRAKRRIACFTCGGSGRA